MSMSNCIVVSTHSRPKAAEKSGQHGQAVMLPFQHTAARRRLIHLPCLHGMQ